MKQPAYFQIDGCDKRFFKCASLRSTLSTDACAENFRRAQHLSHEYVTCRHLCRRCPIGAGHAGVKLIHESPYRGSNICPRCHAFSTRFIGRLRCVSCYNREREFVAGRNAKGSVPQKVKLAQHRVGMITDTGYIEVSGLTKDATEMALATLRVATGRVIFTRAIGRVPAITLPEMVEKLGSESGGKAAVRAEIMAAFRRKRSRRRTGETRPPAAPVDRILSDEPAAPDALAMRDVRARLMERRAS